MTGRTATPEFYLFIARIHHDFRSYCGRAEKIKVELKKKKQKKRQRRLRLRGINNAIPTAKTVPGERG